LFGVVKGNDMYEIEWKQGSAGWREPKCDGVDNSPWSWVSVAERSNAIEAALKQLLDVIEAHECTCFSCDRDGEQYCDCLEREAKRVRAALSPNTKAEKRTAQGGLFCSGPLPS
jgi:hypothetical protein